MCVCMYAVYSTGTGTERQHERLFSNDPPIKAIVWCGDGKNLILDQCCNDDTPLISLYSLRLSHILTMVSIYPAFRSKGSSASCCEMWKVNYARQPQGCTGRGRVPLNGDGKTCQNPIGGFGRFLVISIIRMKG